MKLFDHAIVDLLQQYVVGEHVDSVVLATYGFDLRIGDASIGCFERVSMRIGGKVFSCEAFPCSGPWGLLVRQVVKNVSLQSPTIVRLEMVSGDFVELETAENQYESLVINLPPKGEAFVVEVY
jgi:hypothetical protein